MGWEIGYDEEHDRFVGYGVPAYCDHPGCNGEINRGLGAVCGGEPYGGENGCGLHFCAKHLYFPGMLCDRCDEGRMPFDKSDEHPEWIKHVLTDNTWEEWRRENPIKVDLFNSQITNRP